MTDAQLYGRQPFQAATAYPLNVQPTFPQTNNAFQQASQEQELQWGAISDFLMEQPEAQPAASNRTPGSVEPYDHRFNVAYAFKREDGQEAAADVNDLAALLSTCRFTSNDCVPGQTTGKLLTDLSL